MANPAPPTPNNFLVQQGNGQVYLSWSQSVGASTYKIYKSTDSINFTVLATQVGMDYTDTSVVVGTNYWYQVSALEPGGSESATTNAAQVTPTYSGQMTLGQVRLLAQQKADRVGSQFVTTTEWNTYINQSYFELYDLLITTYEDYYVKAPYTLTTDGVNSQFALPTDFYKLYGVDIGVAGNSNAFVTLKKFDFISRNRFVYPQLSSTYLGLFNLRYRLVGNTLMFIPTPTAGQTLRIWYVPRMVTLLKDSDLMDGVSGWAEYVAVDAAIKALQKEESDVTVLAEQKMMLIKRIEESAMNRDQGQPDSVSDVRTNSERWGSPNGDGGYAGY